MKMLVYCNKQKPYLIRIGNNPRHLLNLDKNPYDIHPDTKVLNGKIVAECDFEVEEIRPFFHWCSKLENETCLSQEEVLDYLDSKDKSVGNPKRQDIVKLIDIKNLKERVMELSDCYKYTQDNILNGGKYLVPVDKAPQNMMRVWVYENGKWVMYILISIRPQWLCKILYKEKTKEARKRVLKEMLE